MHLVGLVCSGQAFPNPALRGVSQLPAALALLDAERPCAQQMEGPVLQSQCLARMLESSGSWEQSPVE